MENDLYFIQGSTLRGIGNAIRTKTGGTEEIPPLDMEAQILSISGGVNFDGLTEVYPVTELTASADLGGMATLTTPFGMVAGNVYLVCWNDTLYSCEAKEAEFGDTPVVAIGNVSALGGEDTGEPFVIGEFSEEVAAEVGVNVGIMPMDGSTTFEVGVYFIAEKGSGSSGSSEYIKYVTFIGGEEDFCMPVITGDTCRDPVSYGYMSTPTKEETDAETYAHSGWSDTDGGSASDSALTNVTEDKTVYAAFNSSPRYYTITYYDTDGIKVLKTISLAYGSTPEEYIPDKDGYGFGGWQPEVATVTGDASYYAQWVEVLTFANASWEKINELAESGESANYFSIGDKKTITHTSNGTTYTTEIEIVGFDVDYLADDTGKAGITIATYNAVHAMTPTTSAVNTVTWKSSTQCRRYTDTIYDGLPSELQAVIKEVKKTSVYIDSTYGRSSVDTTDKIFLLGMEEVGLYEDDRLPDDVKYSLSTLVKKGRSTRNGVSGLYPQTWFLRDSSRSKKHAMVTANGTLNVDAAGGSTGFLVFGFCI